MRGAVLNIIVEYLVAGHDVTVMCGKPEKMASVKRKILDALEDLGIVPREEKFYTNSILLENDAAVQIGQLQHFTGASFLHTPLLVLQDVASANTCLLPDARAIARKFPDGKPPIIIEC